VQPVCSTIAVATTGSPGTNQGWGYDTGLNEKQESSQTNYLASNQTNTVNNYDTVGAYVGIGF